MAADAVGDPDDPVVLLFHGGGQTRHAWGGALDALAARHWYAVSFDLPGHGDSGWVPDGGYDLELFAGSVASVANQFDRPVLVGASLGGLSSLVAIGEHLAPDASALVLVDVTPRLESEGVGRIRDFMRLGVDGFDSLDDVADAVASYLPNRKRPADVNGLRKNVRQREDGRWVWHWDPNFFNRIDDPEGEPTAGRFTHPTGSRTRAGASPCPRCCCEVAAATSSVRKARPSCRHSSPTPRWSMSPAPVTWWRATATTASTVR